MKNELTEKQKLVYQTIRDYQSEFGYSPSVRDLAERLGHASPAGIHKILKVLQEKGYLVKSGKGKSRSLGLLKSDPEKEGRTIKAPVVGHVAAGSPQLAYEENEGEFILDSNWLSAEKPFLLRVQGFSMIDAGIRPGDLLVVEPVQSCHNGEIIIALLEDEATVKRFYRERDRIRLQPENETMQPIYIERNDPAFRIIGKVKGLMRKFDVV